MSVLGFSNGKSLDNSPQANKGGHKGKTQVSCPTDPVCTNHPVPLGKLPFTSRPRLPLKPERGTQPYPTQHWRCLQLRPCRTKRPSSNCFQASYSPAYVR